MIVAASFVVVATMVLPSAALNVRGTHGEIELPPVTDGTGPQFYSAAEYTLDVGDNVDYSFSASEEVFFAVLYRSDIGQSPAPVVVKLWEANVSHGHGVLEADWAGIYFFEFGTENTSASITVSFSINIHESWLTQWGLALGIIAAAAVVLVVVGIVAVRRTKKEGV